MRFLSPQFRRLNLEEPFGFGPGAAFAGLACHKGSSSTSSGDSQTSTQSGAQDQGVSTIGNSNQSNTGTYLGGGISSSGNTSNFTNNGVQAGGAGSTTNVTTTTTDNGAVDSALTTLQDVLAGANNTVSSWLNTTNQTITTLSNNATMQGMAQLQATTEQTKAAQAVAQANQDAAQAVSEGAQTAATLGTTALNSSQSTAAGILTGNNVKYALVAIAALGAVMLLRKKSK